MLNQVLALLFLIIISKFAHAKSHSLMEVCELSGTLKLEENTLIYCRGNLTASDRATVLTQGFNLTIIIQGIANLSDGLSLISFDPTKNAQSYSRLNSGSITIIGTTALGHLSIDNRPADSAGFSGDIYLEFVSTQEYEHQIVQGFGGGVEFLLNGTKKVLAGPFYKPLP